MLSAVKRNDFNPGARVPVQFPVEIGMKVKIELILHIPACHPANTRTAHRKALYTKSTPRPIQRTLKRAHGTMALQNNPS
jgi:hypothetical protein